MPQHKAGFVSIVGKPNVGKSSLMNKLVGENLSIITSKAQTTRHRIMGMLNGDDFQIVYSDTPGILEPKYELHQAMMSYVRVSLEDADLILDGVVARREVELAGRLEDLGGQDRSGRLLKSLDQIRDRPLVGLLGGRPIQEIGRAHV